jgi:hypothetical protein
MSGAIGTVYFTSKVARVSLFVTGEQSLGRGASTVIQLTLALPCPNWRQALCGVNLLAHFGQGHRYGQIK